MNNKININNNDIKEINICIDVVKKDNEITRICMDLDPRLDNVLNVNSDNELSNAKVELKGYLSKRAENRRHFIRNSFEIKDVIFNPPATIIKWADGTKTVVKCQDGDVFDFEKGLAMEISKKALGNTSNFNNIFKKYINKEMVRFIKQEPNVIKEAAVFLSKVFQM